MTQWIARTLLAAALVATATAAAAQSEEKCFGVAPKGQDQGVGDGTTAGASSVDYQGNAWIMVPAGTCLTKAVPVQPDGTPRRGSLEPLDRDRP